MRQARGQGRLPRAWTTARPHIALAPSRPFLFPPRMFQSFASTASPEQGPPRLAALRAEMKAEMLDAFLVPRSDRHQGEYVAPADERLSWLTGFTGSAGFAVVTAEEAAVFVDGRYRLQVTAQVASDFSPVDFPKVRLGPWLADHLPAGSRVGFDPWLHTADEIETARQAAPEIGLVACDNLVDRIWPDRPPLPSAPVKAHPLEVAGETSGAKRDRLAKELRRAGQRAAILTLPDSICWLLNIRGSDVARNPVVQAFAILFDDGHVSVFSDPPKFDGVADHLDVDLHHWEAFEAALTQLSGPVRVDRKTAPYAVSTILSEAEIEVSWGDDPCSLPKARKNAAEIEGMREVHLIDGAAMVEFLRWLDDRASRGGLTEIGAVKALEGFRRQSNQLQDISFETISGAGPNGAIIHYRVTEETDREIREGELFLIDSGGQYLKGTTDITRTMIVGEPTDEMRTQYTRVLQGLIAVSMARFPRGVSGRDIDPLARAALWRAGQDFDHGTGHGVGAYLSVHEGPQRISRISEVPLEPGMILSNEPGYYRDGAYGIRLENLIIVRDAEKIGDMRDQLDFETLTFVPFDRRLIDTDQMGPWEVDWLDRYHAEVRQKLTDRISSEARDWLYAATAPLPRA